MKPTLFFLLLSSVLSVRGQNTTSNSTNTTDPFYAGCDPADYYLTLIQDKGNYTNWTRFDLELLVLSTHRNVLPNVAEVQGGDDIYTALMDLDKGSEPETVHLVYRDIDMNDFPAGNLLTWFREDLWPIARGAVRGTPALTDVHSKKPADSTVLLKKADLFFGECGTVESASACVSPATSETAATTAQDGKIFTPPVDARGDIARALFYTQIRYRVSLGLQLTDCPPFTEGEFAYLSQLIKWHMDDPVDGAEIARNQQACSRWQGNRNPFVDYPELVQQIFGEPDVQIEGTYQYSQCVGATMSPTATPNECSALNPGDLPIWIMNSDDPDTVVIYPLAIVAPGVESLYITNRPYDGKKLLDNGEGTIECTLPSDGHLPGRAFGFGPTAPYADLCSPVNGTKEEFNIHVEGDQLFIYCMDADNNPRFLWGFNNNNSWADAGLTMAQYGNFTSALPDSLKNQGSIVLPHHHNILYTGAIAGFKSDLLKDFMNASNYEGQDDSRYQVDTSSSSKVVGLIGVFLAATSAAFFL